MPFWWPKWRSLNPWKGHLKHPKRSLGRTWKDSFYRPFIILILKKHDFPCFSRDILILGNDCFFGCREFGSFDFGDEISTEFPPRDRIAFPPYNISWLMLIWALLNLGMISCLASQKIQNLSSEMTMSCPSKALVAASSGLKMSLGGFW